jgi:hypothetical protein
MNIQYEGFATAAATVHPAACTISKIHGFKVAANDRYLQLHDAKTTPANAAVPLRVWPIYGTAPFGEGFIDSPVTLANGATFVVSSTANTYTATAETVDIFVNGISDFDTTGTSTTGDYTTGVAALDIFNVLHTLLRLEFTSLTDAGADLYAKLLGRAAGAGYSVGDQPLMQLKLRQATSEDFFFNYTPTVQQAGVVYNELNVVIEATPGPLAGDYVGTDYAIKGTFK